MLAGAVAGFCQVSFLNQKKYNIPLEIIRRMVGWLLPEQTVFLDIFSTSFGCYFRLSGGFSLVIFISIQPV